MSEDLKKLGDKANTSINEIQPQKIKELHELKLQEDLKTLIQLANNLNEIISSKSNFK